MSDLSISRRHILMTWALSEDSAVIPHLMSTAANCKPWLLHNFWMRGKYWRVSSSLSSSIPPKGEEKNIFTVRELRNLSMICALVLWHWWHFLNSLHESVRIKGHHAWLRILKIYRFKTAVNIHTIYRRGVVAQWVANLSVRSSSPHKSLLLFHWERNCILFD